MKILLVNNFFSLIGGAEISFYATGNLLQSKGHEVFYFATNAKPYFEEDYKYSKYFPENKKGFLEKIYSKYYNKKAEIALDKYLQEVRPDIVHFNNIGHNLTLSVINACKKNNVPMVMSVRDNRLFCLGGRFICNKNFCSDFKCLGKSSLKSFINCVLGRCYRDSLYETLRMAPIFFYYKNSRLLDNISKFIFASEAMLNLARKSKFPEEKLIVVNNFLAKKFSNIEPNYSNKGYFLFTGRLSREKGVNCIIEAAKLLPQDIEFHIVGAGAEESRLKKQADGLENIKFLGHKRERVLDDEYRNCIATIVPSNWFEAFGLSIAESFAFSKPVIASNVGGIPELVDDGNTGFLFETGDYKKLAELILYLYNNNEHAIEMGKKAKQKAEKLYTDEVHYNKLIKIYESVISKDLKTL